MGFRRIRYEPDTELRLAAVEAQDEGSAQTHLAADHVTVVVESSYFDSKGEDIIAVAKRSATGQAFPKQPRTGGLTVRSLLKPDPSSKRQNQMTEPLVPHSVQTSVPKSRARKTRTKRV